MIKYVIEKIIKKNKKTNLLSLEGLPKISKYNNRSLKMNILKIKNYNTNLTKKERKRIGCKIISEMIKNKKR
jgi:hypothetical protein